MIAETNSATGATIREYVWLGLTPIASFGPDNPAANDNSPEDCTDEIAALEADIKDRTTRIDNNAARIVELGDLAADKQSRIDNNAARITELGGLITDKQSRIDTNAARITELGALITDKQSRIATNTARITELEALIVDKQNRIAALNPDTRAERIAELEALIITHQERIAFLTTRNGELAALITAHETRITELTTRNAELAALITAHETRVTELTDRNAELASLITGHEERSIFLGQRNEVLTTQRETFQAELDALLATGCNDPAAGSNVTFLHSDHLGRPKFATNANGDEGITTPFGIQITAMAAQTQALMFPGQYQDLETTGAGMTLSHNWHRTYDPTLGRYLQSDPIGLAGGLNRYAYVGGNPLSFVDSTGLDISAIITDKGDGSTTGHAGLVFQDQFGNCFRYDQAAAPGGGIFRDIALLLGLPAPATVNVVPVPCDQLDNGVRVPLTPEQDHKVSQCVIKEMNAPKLYQLYGNNCAGSISSLMRCAGIPVNQPFSPKPDAIRKPFERLRP